jgi:hypothetical protein
VRAADAHNQWSEPWLYKQVRVPFTTLQFDNLHVKCLAEPIRSGIEILPFILLPDI